MSPALLVIDMSEHTYECTICDIETTSGFGIPIYEDEIVPDDYKGEWAGLPVCPGCFYVVRGWQHEHPGEKITTGEIRKIVPIRMVSKKAR